MRLHRHIALLLSPRYGAGEAQALARALLEDEGGLSLSHILLGHDDRLPPAEQQRLLALAQRIAEGEPYQYVVGHQTFCGLRIGVAPGVLIPRPETEEWVEALIPQLQPRPSTEGSQKKEEGLLDLCTGSGCIALALKQAFPQTYVEGRDISAQALAIARRNAASLALDVCFRQQDVLSAPAEEHRWSAIVANPPYVLRSEQDTLSEHVARHEPHIALFVPDSNPLLFHQAIARRARRCLVPGGLLAMEINERLSEETAALLEGEGFTHTHIRPDLGGKPRLAIAQQPA